MSRRSRLSQGRAARGVFADTHFWLALTLTDDLWHSRAVAAEQTLSGRVMVTTDAVLTELLNFVSEYGTHVRVEMAGFVDALLESPDVQVVPCSGDVFRAGLDLYMRRPDKEYSLTDCFSMAIMRDQRIHEVLTHDHHFAQEGFRVLLA